MTVEIRKFQSENVVKATLTSQTNKAGKQVYNVSARNFRIHKQHFPPYFTVFSLSDIVLFPRGSRRKLNFGNCRGSERLLGNYESFPFLEVGLNNAARRDSSEER